MSKRRPLTADEVALWRHAMKATKPLPGRALPDPAPKPEKAAAGTPSMGSAPTAKTAVPGPVAPERTVARTAALQALDAATARRVRRGQQSVDGRIDLHGMRRDEAEDALIGFILSSAARRRRCVLVITGKGGRPDRHGDDAPFMARSDSGDGVLRRMLPVWLAREPLRSLVFACETAHQRDGGSGAFYVFLRKPPQ